MKLKKTIAFLLTLTTLGSTLALPASAEMFGDINGDGAINAVDAASILQYAAYVGAGGKLDLKGFLNGEDEPQVPVDPPAEEDDTLTILAWNDHDLEMMLACYKEDYPDANVEIVLAGGNGVEALNEYKSLLNSGGQYDLIMTESSWVNTYINDPQLALPLSSIGLTEADYSAAFPYTLELGKNKQGELYGAVVDVCPGGFCYNTKLAEEHLGITSPAEMQAEISDWNGFLQTADKLHKATDGSVTMAASLDDMVHPFTIGSDMPTLIDGKLNMEKAAAFAELAKECVDKGYVDPKTRQWSSKWNNAGLESTTMGYFYSTWCLEPGAMLEQSSGGSGDWAIVAGPDEYFWGGYVYCVSPTCNSPKEAEQFLRYFTVDQESMKKYADYSGYMVNNRAVIEDIMASGEHGNPLLGGQDEYSVLYDAAMKIDYNYEQAYEYDTNLIYRITDYLYDNPSLTVEEILKIYMVDAAELYGIES